MMKTSVIVGSTRQGRFSEKPAQWILQQLHKREGIEAQLLDLRDSPMPFFDQPLPPAMPGRRCAGVAGYADRSADVVAERVKLIGDRSLTVAALLRAARDSERLVTEPGRSESYLVRA